MALKDWKENASLTAYQRMRMKRKTKACDSKDILCEPWFGIKHFVFRILDTNRHWTPVDAHESDRETKWMHVEEDLD